MKILRVRHTTTYDVPNNYKFPAWTRDLQRPEDRDLPYVEQSREYKERVSLEKHGKKIKITGESISWKLLIRWNLFDSDIIIER